MKPTCIRVGHAVYPQRGRLSRFFCSSTIFPLPVRRKTSRSTLLRTSVLLVFLSLAVEVCLHHDRFITQAQAPPVRVALTVASAALPVTLGVPLGEIAAVTDVTQLGVIDANGAPVPSQLRVLARWRGLATDTAKPLKWVLVDFKPAAAGVFYLTRAPQTVPSASALVRNETATSIRVTNSQLDIELPKSGGDLVRSFKLGGTEQLRAPLTAQAEVPRGALVNRIDKTINQFTVADATIFRVGETVRFEKIDFTKWDADAGSARLIMWQNEWQTGHRYRIEEGTARVEEFVVGSVPGTQDLRLAAPLRFKHPMGSKVRDLTVETETATVRSVRNQDVQFTAALGVTHTVGEKVIATTTALSTANLSVDSARIEEANALRTVVRQDGRFVVSGARVLPVLNFTLRYYVYADQPFVRVRLRLTNTGSYGWAGINLGKGTFAQHALLRSLSVLTPTVGAGSGTVQVLTAADAHSRLAQNQTGATLAAGSGNNLLEISVPEFTENYPKALVGSSSGMRFDVLPNTGEDYLFEGARAKTTDFYLGRDTAKGRVLTNSIGAKLDPGYIASTGGRMPKSTLANLREKLPSTQVFLMYGLTEAFRATYLPPEEIDRRPDSIGRAIPNNGVLVLREDGTPCGPGEPGELVQRGPMVAIRISGVNRPISGPRRP